MATRWLWKYCFILTWLAGLTAAENVENIVLNGTLFRNFFADTALKQPKDNCIASPLSAFIALGNLAYGASGSSLVELNYAIGVDTGTVKNYIEAMFEELKDIYGITLCIVDKFYLAKDLKVKSSFYEMSQITFKTFAESVDFRYPAKVAKDVNAWVEKNTYGKIKNMLKINEILPTSEMIIVNAVYFKAKWASPFQSMGKKDFYAPHGKIKVNTMSDVSRMGYGESETLNASSVITKPYEDNGAYFLIILPNKEMDFYTMLRQLKGNPDQLEEAVSQIKKQTIELEMPSFEFETEIKLKEIYQEEGVKRVFKSNSGLDGIVKDKVVQVSAVKHKAYINVNENGTVATAATDCLIIMCLAPLSSARKKDNSTKLPTAIQNQILDLSGSLRRKFFVNSALVKPTENSVCSPLSALMPLAKLALGAEDKSLKELLHAIGLSNSNKIKHNFKRLIMDMREILSARLEVASKFYISRYSRLKNSYLDLVRQTFKTNIERVNFHTPALTVNAINSWVSSNTRGEINNIVHESEISPDTEMLIVNAIHLKAKWKTQFEKDNITFHTPLRGTKTVPAMKIISSYNHTDDANLKAKIIKVPYEGGKLDFVIVAPDYLSDLQTLLKDLKSKPELLESAMSRLTNKGIELVMPTFKIETDVNLKRMYQELGVKQIFNGKSGLNRILQDRPISVSKCKQKAFIRVSEQGTEADAASVIHTTKLSQWRPLPVIVDRPFLFFITINNQQLFSGIVTDPTN